MIVAIASSWLLWLTLSPWLFRLSCPPLARRCAERLVWVGAILQVARETQDPSVEEGESAAQAAGFNEAGSGATGDDQPPAEAEQGAVTEQSALHARQTTPEPPSRVAQSGSPRAGRAGGAPRAEAASSRTAQKSVAPGLVVSADLVRRAAIPKNRPAGVFVAEQAGHPCGIEIRSPGLLSGRVQPGDVLVEVEGQPIRGWPVLIGTVTRAYQRRVEAVHGKLWRNGVIMGVTVHIPYDFPAP